MLDKRILMLSGATVACALGIGFFMQQSAAPRSLDMPDHSAGALQIPSDPDLGDLAIENITLTSVPQTPASQMSAQTARFGPLEAGRDCSLSVQADAAPGAMVNLSVSAPCLAGRRLTVHHHGMMFTVTLDDGGMLKQQVPALASMAVIIVEPDEGLAEVAKVSVPDLASVDRIVLQWSGNGGFEIHARENGAEYGATGHVWHGSAPSAGMGRILRLGDVSQLAPRMAEVYSFPRTEAHKGGVVDISVETEITAINCGRDIEAQTLTLTSGEQENRVRTQDLSLAIPGCDATGDFLVLNNLVENLKIASN